MTDTLPTKHMRIQQDLRGKILSGFYQPGEILPSQNELMDEYAVAQGTVRQALTQLQSEQLIVSHRGKGTFVSDRATSGLPIEHTKAATIGLLIVSTVDNDQIVMDQIFTLQQATARLGYEMVMRVFRADEVDAAIDWTSRHDGTVIWGAATLEFANRLAELRRPAVVYGELLDGDCPRDLSWVHDDLDALLDTPLQLMHSMGHRKIWFINRSSSGYFQKLSRTFAANVQRLGIADTCRDVMVEMPEDEAAFARELAKSKDRPTALLIEGDIRACRLIHQLQYYDCSVPGDLGVVALGAAETHRLAVSDLYRVLTPVSTGLVRAAEALVELIDTGRVVRHEISPRLAVGKTCVSVSEVGK